MEPHFAMPPSGSARPPLPNLPIVTPDPPRKTTAEKYGSLFYLSIAGLVVIVGLVGYFTFGVWSLRAVMANIYTLHSTQSSEAERIEAAYALSRDPRVTQHEYWEICLRKPLPPLARYLMAEAITADTVAADPRAYALVVARSEGWPDWLRLQLTRPLAYAAARGVTLPREPLNELARHPDGAIRLWADAALALSAEGDPAAASRLHDASRTDGPDRALAAELDAAVNSTGKPRVQCLDQAALWIRHHHADSARLWDGWRVDGGRLIREHTSAPELQPRK